MSEISFKVFTVFNYWNVPSHKFENNYKPPVRLRQLLLKRMDTRLNQE